MDALNEGGVMLKPISMCPTACFYLKSGRRHKSARVGSSPPKMLREMDVPDLDREAKIGP